MGLEVSFSGDFCVSDLSYFISVWSSEGEFFRVNGYSLSN